jgi:hypothetical protein
VLAAVLGVLVLIVALLARGGGTRFPTSVAGEPRNTSPQAKTAVEVVQTMGALGGVKPNAAYYGSIGGPGVLVAVYHANQADLETLFAQMAAGFSATSSSNLNLVVEVTRRVGSAQFECVPYSGRFSGNLCAWSDGTTVGMVLSIGAVNPDSLDLVSQVYTSIEGP